MKKLLLLTLTILLFGQLDSQQWVSTSPQKKNSLLELFTGNLGLWCPDGHRMADSLKAHNPNRVHIIRILSGGLNTSIPNLKTTVGNTIHDSAGVTGYPGGSINRKDVPWNINRTLWGDRIDSIHLQNSPVNIYVKNTYNALTRVLTTEVEVYYTANSIGNMNRLTVALTQNNIIDTQSGSFRYPVMIVGNKYRHNDVLRMHITPGAWGIVLDTVLAGKYYKKTYTTTLPASINGISVVPENLNVIGFVSANNGNILTAGNSPVVVNSIAPKCSEFRNIFFTKNGSNFIFATSGPATVPAPYTVKYNWTFSNGQTSTQKNPSTTFTTFPAWAKLKICIDSGTTTICCDSSMRDSIVNCSGNIVVNGTLFDAKCSGVADGRINTNVSGGTAPYSYSWSNGANTSNLSNLNSGKYIVTVTDANGCKETRQFIIDTQYGINITIQKIGSNSLRAMVSGGTSPYRLIWNNGALSDSIGGLSNGLYCLTVTDSSGCTATKCDSIGGSGSSNPCAFYRYINHSGSGKSFNFSSGIPLGANATYFWTFGNGSTSTQAKPTYTYPNGGTYAVKLKYCLRDSSNNIICCDSAFKTVYAVTPLPCNVKANFKWNKLANGQVQFTDSTKPDTGNMYTYYWVFGDGTVSTQKNPLKTFATNGSKTVCLYVKKWVNTNNMYCMDTICKSETITNASPCNRLEPKFTWTSTGGVYSFSNITNMTGFTLVGVSYVIHNSNTTYTIANPSHTFTTNGTYTVTMTIVAFDATTGLSCTKTVTKTFYVNTSLCGCFKAYNSFTRTGSMAHFVNNSQCVDTNTKYLYKFGNGDTSNLPSPSYFYTLPGLYRTVMYITRTINGVTCRDSFVRIVQITTANPCKDSGYVNNVSQPCSQFVSPVCGCDTITYKNSCFAMRAGVKIWTYGPCANDTGYVKICGNVYRDINKNCAYDSFDHKLSGFTIKFNTTPVTYAYTNTAGYYQIYLPKGTYQISQVLTFRNPPINQLCPAANAPITVAATTGGATYCNNNFFDTTSLCPDLAVGVFKVANLTPGFVSKKYIRYANRGAVPITGVVLKYRFLSGLTVLSTTTPTYTVSGNVVTWNLGTLPAYTNGTKLVNLQVPVSLALGTTVIDSVWIEPAGGDCDQSNNSATYNDTCVGSYDPNDKAASPAGEMAPSIKTLDYLIRFQNTGTAPAHNVRIEDKIDDNFEKASLQVNDFSHKMNSYFDDNGKIYFEFPNIMLPDSGTDYEASQGYVSYSIQLKDNLPLGTKLKNTAEIYFDFNEPIITNTTVNTIVLKSSSGVQTQVAGLNVSIYPNPTQNIATIEVNLDKASKLSYTLFNIQGKLIRQEELANKAIGNVKQEINLEGLNAGIYILNLSINGKETSLKVVKE
jgi:PKD repeat protein